MPARQVNLVTAVLPLHDRGAVTLADMPRIPDRLDLCCLVAALGLLSPGAARAIDTLSVHVGEAIWGDARATGIDARLTIGTATQSAAVVRIAKVRPGADQPELRRVTLSCARLTISDPRYACANARVDVQQTPIGPLSLSVSGDFNVGTSTGSARAVIPRLAGGRIEMQGRYAPAGWTAEGRAMGVLVADLRTLIAPLFALPDDWTIDGGATAEFTARGRGGPQTIHGTLALADIDLSNPESTIIAEGAAMTLTAALTARPQGYDLQATLAAGAGQALAGPILLDFGQNPLDVQARGTLAGTTLELTQLEVGAPRLLAMHGSARVALGDAPMLEAGRLVIDALEFPAAYTSLMQITLATTDFGDLITSGRASGTVDLARNAVERIGIRVEDVSMYNDRAFFMNHVTGEVRWAAAKNADVLPSWLAWTEGGAYGLSGGASRVQFVTRATNFMLIEPWHMPIFDGAVAIRTLAINDLGGDDMSIRFDAEIEPISMQPLCKAFGWPEFSGSISGSVPGLELRGDELRVAGDIQARVFDGSFVASNLRLVDPLGKWPRFFADLRGRSLDLEQVTRTFAVGSITGRIDVDVLGLELFAWSPVAFDARIETTKGDRSRHRISARAVSQLSNVGGGGGGVTQALQSGLLQFFDEYSYDRLGLRCRLENDICLMSGVEATDHGYYIVKGSGIPRIDIIGNQGRVNWPQLFSQIASGIRNSEGVVVQ